MVRLTLVFAVALGIFMPAVSQDYAEEVKELGQSTALRFAFHESTNFVWASSVPATHTTPAIKAGEEAFAYWNKLTGLDSRRDTMGDRKVLVIITRNGMEYKKVLEWYERTHKPFTTDFAKANAVGDFMIYPNRRPTIFVHAVPLLARQLPNAAAHLIAHMCLHRYKFNQKQIPPWLDEGFACYVEAQVMGHNNIFCFHSVYERASNPDPKATLFDIKFPKWKTLVRDMVKKREDRALRAILPLRLNGLTGEDVGKAWSLVEFLLKKDEKAFLPFLRTIKQHWPDTFDFPFTPGEQAAQERSLKEIYSTTLDELDDAWRKWVSGGMK
jgi:hypothetical protein